MHVKFSAFKVKTPYLLKTVDNSANTNTCLKITHFAFIVSKEDGTIPLTVEKIKQVKDDMKILDDYGLHEEDSYAKQLHYCTHYPVLDHLCHKYYLQGCTNPSHQELHKLPEKLGQNMSLMCKNYFANNCKTARCTKLHKTFESLEEQLHHVLNEKREKCTKCIKIPCKLLNSANLRKEPCFNFFQNAGNVLYFLFNRFICYFCFND